MRGAGAGKRSGKRVLVVEDDLPTRRLFARMIRQLGHSVAEASNGREALKRLLVGIRPCVILMDLEMPVMDGWKLLQALRNDPAWSSIPVVVTSGDVRPDGDLELFTDHLYKPINASKLVDILKRYCA